MPSGIRGTRPPHPTPSTSGTDSVPSTDTSGEVQPSEDHRFEARGSQPALPARRALRSPVNVPAERYMQPLDHGFWKETGALRGPTKVRGYLDFAVSNYEFHKKMAVKLIVTRENGVTEEFLHRPRYKGQLPDGRERWGMDNLSFFPDAGPHGKIKEVTVSYLVQANVDADRDRETCQSEHQYRLASYSDLKQPTSTRGALSITGSNPEFGRHELDTSGARGASSAFQDTVPPVEVYFAPYDHPEKAIIGEIDTVIRAQKKDPGGLHTIHASVFNINDRRIADKLIEAHKAGVEVKLVTAAHQLDPRKRYQKEYKRLQAAGIEVLGVVREGAFASNHTKFAIFDGKVVSTGSFNWETRSADDNSENVMLIRSPEIATLYQDLFNAVSGKAQVERTIDPSSRVNVYYSMQHNVPKVIHDALEGATESIAVSMFTLRRLGFEDEGKQKDVLDALVRAHKRGVKVTVLLEKNIADAGEYYGRRTGNDLTDEWLSAQGIEVTKIRTNMNGNKYASLHHKFAVIDGETTLTGPYNWYHGSKVSDDDLVVIKDKTVAKRYLGEVTNLRRHYDPDFDPSSVPQTPVHFSFQHEDTAPGDKVYVVGNIPELGSWDLNKAVPLDASAWPAWKATVDIPAGTHFAYKLVVKNHWGRFWEKGSNREHTADPNHEPDPVVGVYR